MKFDEVLTDFF